MKRPQRKTGASLLGLAFDGSRLDGVVVRRTNGSVDIKHSFSITLSLDLLTDDPQLAGREIRKHLDAAGVRERRCVAGVPLSWALTHTVKVPELPEADLESFLAIESERGFPYSPDALIISRSTHRVAGGESYATLVAIPRDHLNRLEAVLHAAQLRPVSFSLALASLQPASRESSHGVLALLPGENSVGLQISCGGGIAVLRTVESTSDLQGKDPELKAEQISRELRITLGQLPADLRDSLRRLRVYGRDDDARQLISQLEPLLDRLGIQAEPVREYAPDQYAVRLPPNTAISPALSLVLEYLTGRGSPLEFLPPRTSAWKQFSDRYTSRKLVGISAIAAAIAFAVGVAFLIQQWQLSRWQSQWTAMKPRVLELENQQRQIRKFRPWFDASVRSLSILRRLSEAFPEEGTVSAKTVEIRDPAVVTCSGTARDNQALLQTLDRLRASKDITAVQLEQIRGRSPLQFTFNFRWTGGTGQ